MAAALMEWKKADLRNFTKKNNRHEKSFFERRRSIG